MATIEKSAAEQRDSRELPVTTLKGVGGAMAATLSRLGIVTLGDLLTHLPSKYVRIGEVRPLSAWEPGETARIEVVVTKAILRPGKRVKMVVAEAVDRDGVAVSLTWFGRHWLRSQLPGRTIVCSGELQGKSSLRMDVKEWAYADEIGEEARGSSYRPVYPLTEGLTQERIRALIGAALDACPRIPDPLPQSIRDRYGLPPLRKALLQIHQPAQKSDPGEGRRRLVFDELFPAQLALLLLRRRDAAQAAPALPASPLTETVLSSLPFRLSASQAKVWRKISHRLAEPSPARILLQGEVGSGKTVIAALAAAQAHAAGKRALIIDPTEILARQHADSLKAMLSPAGIAVECITGSYTGKAREAAVAQLAIGFSNVVVGTHALLSDDSERFADQFGIVIVDEQHRFGVEQRHRLIEMAAGNKTGVHLLQLSATPIPRTLAMTVFGDLDIYDLELREDARRQVKTVVVTKDEQWVAAVRTAAERGDGSFVICPRIDDSGDGRGVLSPVFARLLDGLRVGVAHGRQPARERHGTVGRVRARACSPR